MALLHFSWQLGNVPLNPLSSRSIVSSSLLGHTLIKIQGLENNWIFKNWLNLVCVCTQACVYVCVHMHPSSPVRYVQLLSPWLYESCLWFAPPPTPRTHSLTWQSAFNYFWASPEYINLYSQVLLSSCLLPVSFSPAIASAAGSAAEAASLPIQDTPKLPTTVSVKLSVPPLHHQHHLELMTPRYSIFSSHLAASVGLADQDQLQFPLSQEILVKLQMYLCSL